MKKTNRGIRVVGETIDGRLVISGLYNFYETHGVPLVYLCRIIKERGMVPSLFHFYLDGLTKIKSKKARKKITGIISEALFDHFTPYTKEEAKEIMTRLDYIRSKYEAES